MPDPLLELTNVTYTWPGSQRHLGPITASIPPCCWVGLIGPNGSGKSTLLRLIAAFLKRDHGDIRVNGQDVAAMRAASRARYTAFVPQNLETSFDLTVREVVELGRINQLSWKDRMGFQESSDSNQLNRILHDTEITELTERAFTTLSGGEARRTLLAAALMQNSPLLLLDEPTAHLDPGHAIKFLDLVRRRVENEQATVLMAYHDLATVSLYADQLWVMDQGQLVLTGSPEEVLHHPMLPRIYDANLLELEHPRTHRPMLIFP